MFRALVFTLLFLPSAAVAAPAGGTSGEVAADEVAARLRQLTPLQADEVLWLARCIYSESDRPHEQRLVAWVVRNRVETRYRGHTYREVVLETKQFSAFNAATARRTHILGLTPEAKMPAWQEALRIALDVYTAAPEDRPFPVATRHFYSPVSMVGRSEPTWAEGESALSSSALGVDPHRFQFFASIDPELAGTPATILDAPDYRAPGGETGGKTGGEHIVRTSTRRPMPKLKLRGSVARPARPGVQRPSM